MRSKSEHEQELRDALAFAASGADKNETHERLTRAFRNVIVATLEEKFGDSEPTTQPRAPSTLHEQVLHLAQQAEQDGASPAKVVDELCWSLGIYAQTRELKQQAVVGTLQTVMRVLHGKVLA
jgi:hypothetical protein